MKTTLTWYAAVCTDWTDMCSVLIRVSSSRLMRYAGVMLANRTNRIDTLREEPMAFVFFSNDDKAAFGTNFFRNPT